MVKQVSWTFSLVPKGEEEVHIKSYLENLGLNWCYEALEHHALLVLLTRNSVCGGLNVLDTGYSPYKSIFNMEHGCFFLSLLGKNLRKGQERIFHLKWANDRNSYSSANRAFTWSLLGQKDGFCLEKNPPFFLSSPERGNKQIIEISCV